MFATHARQSMKLVENPTTFFKCSDILAIRLARVFNLIFGISQSFRTLIEGRDVHLYLYVLPDRFFVTDQFEFDWETRRAEDECMNIHPTTTTN